MKNEKLIRGIGEVDDRILERYHAIDTRLAHKHARKATAVRVTLVAACVAILLCACLPLGMLVHPAGRAVLKGDSLALTEQLNKIEGFQPWQEKTAERLEQTLPEPVWELLQTIPVLNVLTQSRFAGLTAADAFEDGKPYRLYFLSNGDGTCTLKYVTTDPAFTEAFVIEIPETSPAGDIVAAIDMEPTARGHSAQRDGFPYVLAVSTMESLCETAKANGVGDFAYTQFIAQYLKMSVAGLDEKRLQEVLAAYPIAAMGDVYVFDAHASEAEMNRVYEFLTVYCEWDQEMYEQSVDDIVKLAKKSESRELAELCLTVLRSSAISQVVGISIPKTVSSINNAMWQRLSELETVTVAKDHPTLSMIDGCLVDTSTGTLKLYMREDGKFPANADIRILDSYAFALCDLQPAMGEGTGEVSLQIPEGVTEIRKHCFAGISCGEALGANIYLPASLSILGGEMQEAYDCDLIFCYPGSLEEWGKNVTIVQMAKGDYIYLLTSDASLPITIAFSEK